jgi:hypothetical protein
MADASRCAPLRTPGTLLTGSPQVVVVQLTKAMMEI